MKEVEDLVIDRLYTEEETIELFARLDVTEVLENQIIDSVVSNIFQGRYIREPIFVKSTAYKALMEGYGNIKGKEYDAINTLAMIRYRHDHYSTSQKDKKTSGKSIGLKMNCGNNKKSKRRRLIESKMLEKGHIFQFYVWKESFDSQHYFNIFCTIILGIAMLIFASRLLDKERQIESIVSGVSDLNTLSSAQKEKLKTESDTYFTYFITLLILCLLTFGYLFRNLEVTVYSVLKQTHIGLLNEAILNAITTLLTLYWIGKYFGEYSLNLGRVDSDLKIAVALRRMNNDSGFDFSYFVSTIVGIQFIRVLILLKAHRTFGPMIKTIFVMFYDLFVFMIIFF